jgi:hypothetical protein
VVKPEGKRPLGRPWLRWEDNIKMRLQEVGWGGMDWINLAQVPICATSYSKHKAKIFTPRRKPEMSA